MYPDEDTIVEISKARERFFGCSGKMLKPCPATVAAVVKKVPENQLATTDLLRRKLAEQFQVQVTCPSDFKQALLAAASGPAIDLPYWRVVKQNGELIPRFPGGVEAQAARLEQEGFTIDTSGKKPRVIHFKAKLANLD
jgi:hypothetical protein